MSQLILNSKDPCNLKEETKALKSGEKTTTCEETWFLIFLTPSHDGMYFLFVENLLDISKSVIGSECLLTSSSENDFLWHGGRADWNSIEDNDARNNCQSKTEWFCEGIMVCYWPGNGLVGWHEIPCDWGILEENRSVIGDAFWLCSDNGSYYSNLTKQ